MNKSRVVVPLHMPISHIRCRVTRVQVAGQESTGQAYTLNLNPKP
jgi:hypothetical protein